MRLSFELEETINELIKGLPLSELVKQSEILSGQYRNRGTRPLDSLISENQRLAYLAARFPATYAVGCKVFAEALKICGNDPLESLLDIGAGPGTLLLAAAEMGLPLYKGTMAERDPGFIKLGKQLTSSLGSVQQEWISHDLRKDYVFEPHDVVVASYSLNELNEEDRLALLERLWQAAQKILIIIEPGTKAAFESLKTMRQKMLTLGAHLAAPCPHSNNCPLQENDWCHFSVRIERSSLHRKTKLATLNYEDEKFSYLIFSKKKIEPCHSRVLRHPYKGTGFIKLQLCSRNGIEEQTITKKNKLQYTSTKKIEWGDGFN